MTILQTGVSTSMASGTHNVQVVIGTGTAKLQYSTDSLAFIDIPSSSVSASSGFDVSLPSCSIKAVLTGDATLAINQVSR